MQANVVPIGFVPGEQMAEGNMTLKPASRQSVDHFEKLLNGSGFIKNSPSELLEQATQYTQALSDRWAGKETAMQHVMNTDDITQKELLMVQYQMTNAVLGVELTSKIAGTTEHGIQTLIQRSQ